MSIPKDPNTVDYFFGRISRTAAEKILKEKGCMDGLYLLRLCITNQEDYAVAICYQERVHHYAIKRQPDGKVMINGGKKYPGPVELINHHKSNADGMVVKAKHPCARSGVEGPYIWPGVTMADIKFYYQKQKEESIRQKRPQPTKDTLIRNLHKAQKWFAGMISRETAEDRLLRTDPRRNGEFLIRQREDDSMALSVLYNNIVCHYNIQEKVEKTGDKYTIVPGPSFDCVMDLVTFYHNGGLQCPLHVASGPNSFADITPSPPTVDKTTLEANPVYARRGTDQTIIFSNSQKIRLEAGQNRTRGLSPGGLGRTGLTRVSKSFSRLDNFFSGGLSKSNRMANSDDRLNSFEGRIDYMGDDIPPYRFNLSPLSPLTHRSTHDSLEDLLNARRRAQNTYNIRLHDTKMKIPYESSMDADPEENDSYSPDPIQVNDSRLGRSPDKVSRHHLRRGSSPGKGFQSADVQRCYAQNQLSRSLEQVHQLLPVKRQNSKTRCDSFSSSSSHLQKPWIKSDFERPQSFGPCLTVDTNQGQPLSSSKSPSRSGRLDSSPSRLETPGQPDRTLQSKRRSASSSERCIHLRPAPSAPPEDSTFDYLKPMEDEGHNFNLGRRYLRLSEREDDDPYYAVRMKHDDVMNIRQNQLELVSDLGSGHYGSVKLAKFQAGGKFYRVAVKTLKPHLTSQSELMKEAKVMASLDHPHIIRLVGVCKSDVTMLILELAEIGTLREYLKQNKDSTPMDDIIELLNQVATGMAYLEKHHVVHRDLAARNILLCNRNHAKISDFGLSRSLGMIRDYYEPSTEELWPIKWYPLEVLNDRKFDSKSDVWSFGVTMWEATSYSETPYKGMLVKEYKERLSQGYRLDRPSLCPKSVYRIMYLCWAFRKEDRPTFDEILKHFQLIHN